MKRCSTYSLLKIKKKKGKARTLINPIYLLSVTSLKVSRDTAGDNTVPGFGEEGDSGRGDSSSLAGGRKAKSAFRTGQAG